MATGADAAQGDSPNADLRTRGASPGVGETGGDTGVFVANLHSPWQRPTNENTNGLLQQYFSKGTDLSGYSQQRLTHVAEELNNRFRKCLGFRALAEVMAQQVKELHAGFALQT